MLTLTSDQAKTLIKENEEIILEKQAIHKNEPSRFKRNMINSQIKNRQTTIKSLEQFVK